MAFPEVVPMPSPSWPRVIAGVAVWAALGFGAFAAARQASARLGDVGAVASRVWRYASGRPARAAVRFPEGAFVLPGDGVYVRDPRGVRAVGQVRSTAAEGGATAAVVEFYDPADAPARGTRFHAVPNALTPAWTVEVLLPPERRARILEDLRAFTREHRLEILETFWTPSDLFLRDAVGILEEDLPAVLRRRDDQVQKLLKKHRDTTFEKEMLPVLKAEAWPRVQERSRPLVEEVGEELWKGLPKWELGWRYVYGQLPGTDSDVMRKRFDRYVEEEAVPILTAHTEDFLAVLQEVLSDLAANPRVAASLRGGFARVVEDPEFTALLGDVFAELLSSEGRLLAAFRARFTSPEFTDRLNRLFERLGPCLESSADRILLADDGGIHPDLARVLRRQIFLKDACWILVEPGAGPPAPPDAAFEGDVVGWREGLAARRGE
jgi:hypothetical protein